MIELFVCLKSHLDDTIAQVFGQTPRYFGLVVKRSEKDIYGVQLLVELFYAVISWSEEENRDDYLRRWKTEIDIYYCNIPIN